jgi:hypothetical protein
MLHTMQHTTGFLIWQATKLVVLAHFTPRDSRTTKHDAIWWYSINPASQACVSCAAKWPIYHNGAAQQWWLAGGQAKARHLLYLLLLQPTVGSQGQGASSFATWAAFTSQNENFWMSHQICRRMSEGVFRY